MTYIDITFIDRLTAQQIKYIKKNAFRRLKYSQDIIYIYIYKILYKKSYIYV